MGATQGKRENVKRKSEAEWLCEKIVFKRTAFFSDLFLRSDLVWLGRRCGRLLCGRQCRRCRNGLNYTFPFCRSLRQKPEVDRKRENNENRRKNLRRFRQEVGCPANAEHCSHVGASE